MAPCNANAAAVVVGGKRQKTGTEDDGKDALVPSLAHTPSLCDGRTENSEVVLGLTPAEAERYRGLMEKRLMEDDASVEKVVFDPEPIKSGYICDINLYKVHFKAETGKPVRNIILKVSNFDNALSSTAKQLDMYYKEAYFYDKLRRHVKSVAAPETFGVIQYGEYHGIMMEDLRVYEGEFNSSLKDDTKLLYHYVSEIFKLHNEFLFLEEAEVHTDMQSLVKPIGIQYYLDLVQNRFDKFWRQSEHLLSDHEKLLVKGVQQKYPQILGALSQFPLSFCHGDVKSPNTFYRRVSGQGMPTCYFLDWQYIHLNKGVSDVAFLLIESLAFDKELVPAVERYYWELHREHGSKLTPEVYPYETYLHDFKCSICSFAFFVMVWFNSEDKEELVDPDFPTRFLKNLMAYYNHYIDLAFLESL